MPIVSFAVNQNRLTKSPVGTDAETVNKKAVGFVAKFSVVSKSHPVQMRLLKRPRSIPALTVEMEQQHTGSLDHFNQLR